MPGSRLGLQAEPGPGDRPFGDRVILIDFIPTDPHPSNEGFKSTASKEDMKAMEGRLTARLDKIENLLLEEQKRKLEHLEARVKRLEDALAV